MDLKWAMASESQLHHPQREGKVLSFQPYLISLAVLGCLRGHVGSFVNSANGYLLEHEYCFYLFVGSQVV